MDQAVLQLVRQRAHDRCEYCHLTQAGAPIARFHIEHIVPKQHGGDDDPANLALACPRCNFHKGSNLKSVDPATSEIVALFDPRVEAWDGHFVLRGARIRGRSPTGRATARLLQMNAPERMNARAELLARGEL